VTLIGRLAAAPELSQTTNGGEIIRYTVGTNYGSNDKKPHWFKVAAFEDRENSKNYLLGLEKGSLIYVEGEMTTTTYEDPEGKVRSRINIKQTRIQTLARSRRRPEEPLQAELEGSMDE